MISMAKKPQNTPAQDWDAPTDTGFTAATNPESDAAADELEQDEAARRAELTNLQTTREFEEGRDGVSGTQNPGVVAGQTGHTSQGVAGDNDMSGKVALPDPLKALDPKLVNEIHTKLKEADKEDQGSYKAPKGMDEDAAKAHKVAYGRSTGWRTLADLGVHRETLRALVRAGKVEEGAAPGMQHHPDTGVKYRILRDRG
jgi:hypothetical protein